MYGFCPFFVFKVQQSSDGETLANKHWQEVVFNLKIPFEKQSSDGTYKRSACKQYNISTESMRKWISGALAFSSNVFKFHLRHVLVPQAKA